MSWMAILKREYPLPHNPKTWLKILEHKVPANAFVDQLEMLEKNPQMTVRHLQRFIDNVNDWKNGNAAASEITPHATKLMENREEKRNLRITVRDNYNMIYDDLLKFIRVRKGLGVKGAAVQSADKRSKLINLFNEAKDDIDSGRLEHVDWNELNSYFKKTFTRQGKTVTSNRNINRFIEQLGETTKKIIYDNSPEDWPIKEFFKAPLSYEDDAQEDESGKRIGSIREIKNYRIEQIDINKAIEYIKKYCEFKVKSKTHPTKKGERIKWSLTPMSIKEIEKLQYSHGNLKKRHTDKLFITLLESHDVNTMSHMKIWLENIKRKYAVRLDLLQDSFLEQSWRKFKDDKEWDDGYVHTSFVQDFEDKTEEQNKQAYIEEVSSRINQSGEIENRDWVKWKNKTIKDLGETKGLPTLDFVNFINAINEELKSGDDGMSRIMRAFKDIYSEDEIKRYKNTIPSDPVYAGFGSPKSAPHPLQSDTNVGYFNLPKADTPYAEIVSEIYNGIKDEDDEFDKLITVFDSYKLTNKTRESSLPDIGQLFTEGGEKAPMQDAVNKFSNDLEKALAYTIYDIILSDESIQNVLVKDLVKRYRGTDINFVEAIAVLRKTEVHITKSNILVPKLDKLNSDIEGQNKDELKLSIKRGNPAFEDEIKEIAIGMEEVLKSVKQKVIDLVTNKLLKIIRNQNAYQAKVKANVMEDLVDEGFIGRENT